jgi:hypothetical protein
MRVKTNEQAIRELARLISGLNYNPITFDSPDLFPSGDEYIYANYVFFLVAIDHRTGFPRNKNKYHGSDMLFYLARKAQKREPDLFTAEKMLTITEKDVLEIFTIDGFSIKKPGERAALLRDCAEKLIQYYKGDIRNLFKKADYFLIRNSDGVLARLKAFRAYEDPLMKKSFLLVKILRRQKIIDVRDVHNLGLPVDNVLVEIALRSGIVGVEEYRTSEGVLNSDEAIELRRAVGEAFKKVSVESGITPDIIDDLLWTYGREIRELSQKPIKTPLGDRIGSKEALREFLSFIGKGTNLKLSFPETWYF